MGNLIPIKDDNNGQVQIYIRFGGNKDPWVHRIMATGIVLIGVLIVISIILLLKGIFNVL